MADKQALMARFKAVRRGLMSKMNLLDDGDTNIGNAEILVPYPNPFATVAVNQPISNPPRILFLDALSPTARTVTIGLTASTIISPDDPFANATPITGIIEFGNGARFTRIEVDVPVGPVRGIPVGATIQLLEPEDGVTLVTLPAGTLRVYGRNDSKLITADISGFAGNTVLFVPIVGGIPPVGGVFAGQDFAASVTMKAFVTYMTVRAAVLLPTKTYYIGRTGGPGTEILYINSPNRAYVVPPLAKRFKVLRISGFGTTMALVTVVIYDPIGTAIETFTIPAGTPSPWIELPGIAHRISLGFILGASDGMAALVFEIGA